VSALQANSYEGVVSIEHEDALLSIDEPMIRARLGGRRGPAGYAARPMSS
jgi:sugar phosphate isomerase/epimerase